MLSHGDELGRTQRGNNNAYCQDNEISWVDWERLGPGDGASLSGFVQRLARLRREHPVFRRRRFFVGRTARRAGAELPDLVWPAPGGAEMTDADWSAGFTKSFAIFLNGDAITEPDPRGRRIEDDSFLLLFNAHDGDLEFTVPPARYGTAWAVTVDTAAPAVTEEDSPRAKPGQAVPVASRSVQVLRRV